MSDYVSIIPDYGTPEYDQFLRGQAAGVTALPRALTQLPKGLASAVTSAPDAQGVEKFIPGAVTNLYGFLDDAQAAVGRALGTPEIHLPGATRAKELSASGLGPGSIADMIPSAPPQNNVEATLGDMAKSAGQMGVPLPIDALPAVVRTGLELALPASTSAKALPIAAGITGGVDALTGGAQAAEPDKNTINIPKEMYDPSSTGVDENLPVPPIPPTNIPPVSIPQPSQISTFEVHIPFDDMLHPDTQSTWQDKALWGLGAIAVLGLGPKALRFVGDLAGNTRDMRYAAESAPYNAQQQAFDAGTIPHTDAPLPAPLPGRAGDASTTLAEQVLDRNARLKAYTDATAASPSAAQELRARTGLLNNDMAFRERFQWTAQTGEDPVSGIKIPSMADHYTKIGDGTDQQRGLYDSGRSAADELDNRFNNWRQNPTGNQQTSVKYQGYTDAQLRGEVSAARADPEVAAWMDERNAINNGKVDILQARDMLTSSEAQRLKAAHPNFLSTADVSGLIENPLASRDITPGSGQVKATTPAWELDKQHDEAIFKAIEQNEMRSNIIRNAYADQQANPQNARVFRPSKNAQGEWVAKTDGTSIPVRIGGELQHHIVDSPPMRDALMQSPHLGGGVISWMNASRNASQSAITGTGSAIVGHWYAPKGAVRYALEGSIIRPKGTAGSYPDKAVQMLTGGRLALRGDPSAVATMPYEILAGTGARGAQALASALDPAATNFANVKLRSIYGGPAIDALHNRLQATWYNSVRAQMMRSGASNAAGYSSVPIPNAQMGARANTTSTLNNLAPNLFRVNGPAGSAMPTFVRMNALFNEIKEIVGGAAHAQYFRLNPQLSNAQRAINTRELVGDPGRRGMSRLVQDWGAITDYGNIALQEGSAVGRSWKDNPATFSAAMLTGLGIPALASIYSAMLYGPAAVKHMTDMLSNQEAASSVYMYVPGQPVESAMKIPLGINLHMFYPMIRQALMDVVGLQSHGGNPGLAQWAMDGMHDFFSKYTTQAAVDQTVAGASAALPPVVPSVMNATIEALTGKQVSPTLDTGYQMWDKFPNTGKMFSHDISGDPRAPGRVAGGDTLTGTAGGNLWKHIITSTMGIVGQAIDSAANAYSGAVRGTGDQAYAFGNVLRDYEGRLQESLPFLNGVVWNHGDRLAIQTPLVQRVSHALDAMKPLSTWKSDITWEGFTRAKGQQLPPAPDEAKFANDPVIRQMAVVGGTYSKIIEEKMMPQIMDLRKQIQALNSSPLAPETVRDIRNGYVTTLQKKYEQVAGMINDTNDALSKIAGKHVTVTTINWQRDSSQFK